MNDETVDTNSLRARTSHNLQICPLPKNFLVFCSSFSFQLQKTSERHLQILIHFACICVHILVNPYTYIFAYVYTSRLGSIDVNYIILFTSAETAIQPTMAPISKNCPRGARNGERGRALVRKICYFFVALLGLWCCRITFTCSCEETHRSDRADCKYSRWRSLLVTLNNLCAFLSTANSNILSVIVELPMINVELGYVYIYIYTCVSMITCKT
jgi:hypothetical protein